MHQSGALPEGIRHDRPSSLPTAQQIRRNPALGQTTVEHSCTQSRKIATDSCNLIPRFAPQGGIANCIYLVVRTALRRLWRHGSLRAIESHWTTQVFWIRCHGLPRMQPWRPAPTTLHPVQRTLVSCLKTFINWILRCFSWMSGLEMVSSGHHWYWSRH